MAEKEFETDDEYPEVPEKYWKYLDNPYGGLLGNAVQVQMVEKIVADPTRVYRPKDFKVMLDISTNSIKKSLNYLTELKLLIDVTKEKYRPEYIVNNDSKQLMALTFLAYAVLDDRDGTDLMDQTIADYYCKIVAPSMDEKTTAIINWYKSESTGETSSFSFVYSEQYSNQGFIKASKAV